MPRFCTRLTGGLHRAAACARSGRHTAALRNEFGVNPEFLTAEDHDWIKKLRRLTTLLPEGVFPGLDGHT